MLATKKGAIIALFGKPNVGKSTIFNNLQTNVYAIVTNKAQTTRNYITAKIETDDKQLIILDTPGFHNPNNKLDMFLNSQVKYALKLANVACYILDPTQKINEEDYEILRYISNLKNKDKLLIVNKIDISDEKKIQSLINEIETIVKFDNQIRISAINKDGIDKLKEYLLSKCIHDDINFASFIEPGDDFVTKEIIREVCLLNLRQEVPYGISVIINKFNYNQESNQLNIEADLYVEKESQKGIVVGKQASMIKKIGIDARKKLLEIYDCKIDLRLYVKVKEDWRNNNDLVKLMGYKK